jgi:hypothetical protein
MIWMSRPDGIEGRDVIVAKCQMEGAKLMPTFNHVQEVKKAIPLPVHPGEQIGVCLTCKYWQVEETRTQDQTPKVAICVEPHLKNFALIVSGASGCDKWQDTPNASDDAQAYAHWGEPN